MEEKFKLEFQQLEENSEIKSMVYDYLVNKGLDSTCKGFAYLLDIITLSLVKKKYSRTTIAELTSFIAYKNGIKDFSVQRQMRYVCTVKTNNKYKAIDICSRAWYEIRNELEKRKGNGNDW